MELVPEGADSEQTFRSLARKGFDFIIGTSFGYMDPMATVAEDMVSRVCDVIISRDVEAAIALGRDDEEMDQLRRTIFTELLGDEWSHGVEAAVDIALLGRYYERIADHAVSVANRVVFVVTGEVPARD